MSEAARKRRPRFEHREEEAEASGEGIASQARALAEHARSLRSRASAVRAEQRERGVAEGPSVEVLKESPAALAAAIRRHQVKKIASVANPLSPDTEHVFTIGGARYAKTGVYVPTVGERAAEVRRAAYGAGEAWWERNKKMIVMGALGGAAIFLLYSTWKNAELRRRLDAQRRLPGPYRTGHEGYYPEEPDPEATWEPAWPWYTEGQGSW
jgi:hypothetical protein